MLKICCCLRHGGIGTGRQADGSEEKATYTGASKGNANVEEAMDYKMKLTEEGQAILDGKDGEEKAKLMKILVILGNTFGAEKPVDLGGAPHMSSMIKMLGECAKAGHKSYETASIFRHLPHFCGCFFRFPPVLSPTTRPKCRSRNYNLNRTSEYPPIVFA